MAIILKLDETAVPSDGDILIYDATTETWIPGPAPSGGGGGGSSLATINAKTGNYTLVVADGGGNVCVEIDSATPCTLTVPTNAAQAIAVGSLIEVKQMGAGQVTIAFSSGVTAQSRGDLVDLAGQFAVASLRKREANVWSLAGDLS